MKRINKLLLIITASIIFFGSNLNVIEANTAYRTFTEDGYGRYVETQTAYTVTDTIVRFDDELFLQAEDIKIGSDGNIYIADTGNRRILVGDRDGNFIRTIGEDDLTKPTGLFLSHDDKIYVADELAMRIFVYSLEGELLQEFGKPDSILFGENANFIPEKVAVDRRDNIYIISRGNPNGIIQINANTGQFLGYFAPNATSVTLMTRFRRAIFTEEQLSRMIDIVPSTATNLNIDERGLVYSVSQGENVEAIRKLNVAGQNILDTRVADNFLTSVEIGSLDNIFVASERGFIYEYTSEGNLLFVFGGQDDGRQRVGLFRRLAAIATDGQDRLYALDRDRNQIQVFQKTEFAELVHQSLELYQDGDYEASKEPWEEVIRLNSLFDFAYLGIGEAYFREEDYDEALASFRQAKYRDGYSDAFWEVRNVWMRENIISVLFIIVGFLVLLKVVKIVERKKAYWKRFSSKANEKYNLKLIHDIAFIKNIIKHPLNTYYSIQYENKGSMLSASFWLFILFAIFIAEKYFSGFIFLYVRDGQYTLGTDIAMFFSVFALVIVSNYLICTINEGEGKFRHIYIGFIYSFAPYFIVKPFLVFISNFLTYNEAYLLQLANTIIYAWVAILIFIMIKEINDYTVRETFKIIFLTLFMILITVLFIFIVYVLIVQMIQFVVAVVNEGVYRIGNG
ncbi:tetratricopeptide (TPR) repeat protein [Natronobacillus azotifigens]|uniref:Yip1 domain-containing protein n=1 Tax=Natronobacillus azotifigens TaxID=472978 RepID=A0A9J6RA69_9BACI|nr:YIP1 family protein [Natronobacillus azotifigens]MCZ0702153.1 hypothetical protein [Natronobacillus azotifigens]